LERKIIEVVLYEALNMPIPTFGHISLILGKDHTKMSKRHGATSVDQYRQLGYLPEAIVNYLALLGWAPQDEKEIFSSEELIAAFSMDHVAKNPAVFEIDKLNWINAQYMKQAAPERIALLAVPHLVEKGYISGPFSEEEMKRFVRFIAVIQDHLSYAAQVVDFAAIYFNDKVEVPVGEMSESLLDETAPAVIEMFKEMLQALDQVTAETVQPIFKAIIKAFKANGQKIGGQKVYMPLRVAITGQMHGPDLAQIIEVLGRERVIARIDGAMASVR